MRDSGCPAPNGYGPIPKVETENWKLPWLNNFRKNVQDKGIFDAPDPAVTLAVPCLSPLVAVASVRNLGLASVPAGVDIGVFAKKTGGDVKVAAGAEPPSPSPGPTRPPSPPIPPTH